jgi:hypothetical protein
MDLQTIDWQHPNGKLEVIQSIWGCRMPDSLWYYLGHAAIPPVISSDNLEKIYSKFFSIEVQSLSTGRLIIGHSSIIPEAWVLLVSYPKIQNIPLEINICGQMCPLYVVGQLGKVGYINFVLQKIIRIEPRLAG